MLNNAQIKTIQLKHKSKIKGKSNKKTEYYYEITLESNFQFSDALEFNVHPQYIFDKWDDKNRKLLHHYLPALTTMERIQSAASQSAL